MRWLELKLPPPLVWLLCAGLAWALARISPTLALPWPGRLPLAALLVLLGGANGASGILAFRAAHTTVDPHAPEKARALVRAGPYRFTRNPMYLGLLLMLLAVCAWLSNPLTLVAPVLLVGWLTRFQIQPEERILLEKFGAPYAEYLRATRRWI